MSLFDEGSLSFRARRFGDDVSTDYIIASSRKKETIDTSILRNYVFEDIAPGFHATVKPGDVVVAGSNFGCGSAMEIAVTVLVAAGFRTVIAQSFARTFLRNAFNNGLVPLAADTSGIAEGEILRVSGLGSGQAVVHTAGGGEIACEPIPAFMLDMLEKGGLVPYLKERKRFVAAH